MDYNPTYPPVRISVIGPSACGKTTFIHLLHQGIYRRQLNIGQEITFTETGRPYELSTDHIYHCDTRLCHFFNHRNLANYITQSNKIIIVYCPPEILKINIQIKIDSNPLETERDFQRLKLHKIAAEKYKNIYKIKRYYKYLINEFPRASIYRTGYFE